MELQEELRRRGWSIPVILLTAFASTPGAVRAMKNGAVTMLEKPCRDDELWEAVRDGLAGTGTRVVKALRISADGVTASADEWAAHAEDLGVEIADVVDAANTYAVDLVRRARPRQPPATRAGRSPARVRSASNALVIHTSHIVTT